MRNIKSHISASNMKKLNPIQPKPSGEECKCANDRKIVQCPVNGQCTTNNVVYSAEIKSRYTTKTYIGMTGRPFIDRFKEHRGNTKHKHQKGTKLSKFIWTQRELGENINFEDLKWSLKNKAVPYWAGAKYCDTCLSEKTQIALSNPSEILNSRREIERH